MESLNYTTGLLSWPALGVVALVERRWNRQVGLVALFGLGTLLLATLSYERPAWALPPLAFDPMTLVAGIAAIGGSLFSDTPATATLLGVVASVTAAWLGVTVVWQGQVTLSPMLAVCVYAAGSFAMFAVSRLGFGDGAMLASRYATLPALSSLASWRWSCTMPAIAGRRSSAPWPLPQPPGPPPAPRCRRRRAAAEEQQSFVIALRLGAAERRLPVLRTRSAPHPRAARPLPVQRVV